MHIGEHIKKTSFMCRSLLRFHVPQELPNYIRVVLNVELQLITGIKKTGIGAPRTVS
jgi:hypothetical protein